MQQLQFCEAHMGIAGTGNGTHSRMPLILFFWLFLDVVVCDIEETNERDIDNFRCKLVVVHGKVKRLRLRS